MSKASAYFISGDVSGKHDTKAIKRGLDALPGVLSVSVSDEANRVAVDYDDTGVQRDRIEKQLEKMGYRIADSEPDSHVM